MPNRPQDTCRLFQEIRDVDRLAGRRKGPEVVRSACEHIHGTVMVLALDVVEPNPNLEDALIQATDVTRLFAPEILQRFVLLKKLTAVELRDAGQQQPRWRLATPVAHRPDYNRAPYTASALVSVNDAEMTAPVASDR